MTKTQESTLATGRDRWKGQLLAPRLAHMKKIFVKHDAIKDIAEFIEKELPLRQSAGHATGVLVIAESGSGKTSFVDFLKRLYPNADSPTLSTRKVIRFKVPSSPTPKGMAKALLKALEDPLYDHGSEPQMMERAEMLIQKVGTIIIAIDDFQDVPSKRKKRGVEAIANWIRDLCDLPFPGLVVALGTQEAAIVRDAHPQLLRRMQPRFELPVFSMESPEAAKTYRILLRLVDQALPLADESGLSNVDIARRLIAATGGIFDYLMKLLAKALVRTVERGSESIELHDLEQAFKDQHQVAARGGNPFSASWNGAALTEPGQIFHRYSDGDDDAEVEGSARASSKKRTAKR